MFVVARLRVQSHHGWFRGQGGAWLALRSTFYRASACAPELYLSSPKLTKSLSRLTLIFDVPNTFLFVCYQKPYLCLISGIGNALPKAPYLREVVYVRVRAGERGSFAYQVGLVPDMAALSGYYFGEI